MATKPNVMLVMDYSGSMQFRAHYDPMWCSYYGSNVAYGYRNSTNCSVSSENSKVDGIYDPTHSYYGLFQSNVYYEYDETNKYWVPAATQPVTAYTFSDKSKDGGPVAAWASGRAYAVNGLVSDGGKSYMCTTAHTSDSASQPGTGANWTTYWVLAGTGTEYIEFTASGHTLQVGQLVEFQGLTSHTGMNGNAFYVTAVSGSSFKVAYPWNGNPDQASGSAQRRIPGTLLTTYGGVAQTRGLSGNILNYASASRMDAALQALIGGPGICDIPDAGFCQIRGQGQRSYLREATSIQGEFYVRPATTDSTAQYPDDYGSGSYTGKTTYISLSGRYGGSVTTADPTLGSVCTEQHCATTPTCIHYGCDDADCTHKPCTHETCTHWTCTSAPGQTCTEARCQSNNWRCRNRTCDTLECDQWGPCDACNNWQCDQWQCDNWVCDTWSNTGNYYEAWTFTTGSTATHIDLTLTGTWTGGARSYLALFNGTDFTQTPVASNTAVSTTSPALISANLSANTTYYLVVAPNLQNQTGTYTLAASQELTGYDFRNPSNPSVPPGAFTGSRLMPPGFTVPIGSIPQAQAKIKIDKNLRSGVIQQTFSQVRYGFMYYNASSGNRGKILVGCENTNLDTLLNAFTYTYPYNGTPTGEALEEAYDYFKQNSDHSNADNSLFISPGNVEDPYYQSKLGGGVAAVPCRKSYVVLLSDGAWNSTIDPIIPARAMHVNDLRTLPGDDTTNPSKQSVDVYSIFAFDSSEAGRNAMKGIAAYGGFTEESAYGTAGYPYDFASDTPSIEYTPAACEAPCEGGKTQRWPRPYCDPTVPLPSGHTYDTGCKEWDLNWDKYTAGDNLDKGIPDNYFEASEGQELQAALLKVLSGAIVKNATASAVATVAQETQQGDIIIRGLFHAADPDTVGRYLWLGHLEAYWPDNTGHYDFETNHCFEITGTKNCWNGAEILQGNNNRTIFSTSYNSTTKVWDRLDLPTVPRSASAPYAPLDPPWDATTTTDWQTRLGLSGILTAPDLIDWVRGSDQVLGSAYSFRDRTSDGQQWRLGDIIYSTPVVVGTPSVGGISTHDPDRDAFYAYRNQVYYRDKIVYVGANDGMIHAFLMARWDDSKKIWLNKRGTYVPAVTDPNDMHDDNIGKELWAYIPSNLLTELQYLAPESYGTAGASGCVHRTMVDLAPQSWEVYIKPPGATTKSWRTVILGGQRGGGDVYFAIDVTDPIAPTVLWEYSMLKNRVVYDRSGTRRLDLCNSAPSDANCKAGNFNVAYLFIDSTTYEQLKVLPVAWSRPAVGRLRMPTTLDVFKLPTSTTAGLSVPSGLSAWSSTDWDDKSPWPQNNYHQPRHVAFIGGGVRIFQDDTTVKKDPTVVATTEQLSAAYRFDLFRPELMAIDIETGTNLLTYYWPKIQDQTAFQNLSSTVDRFYKLFPAIQSGSNYVPYSLSDPLALDVRNGDSRSVGDDGYVDTVYVGDLLGNFYGLKFNFDNVATDATSGDAAANTDFGIRVDWWQTKTTWEGNPATNTNIDYFRGLRQPITVPPVASFDGDTSNGHFLHVIFGAGKFEDIPDSTNDDMADPGRTSIYNLKDLVEPPKTNFFSSNAQTVGNFKIEVNPRCPQSNTTCGSPHTIRNWPNPASGNEPCVWIKDDLVTRDCGEATCPQPANPSNPCADPCWNCIFDLRSPAINLPADLTKPGERVVRKGLIAGGILFVTASTPPESMCESLGKSLLYVLSYDCGIIPGGKNIFLDASVEAIGLKTGDTNTYDPRGWVVGLGDGVASNPVLDSTGTHVIIQMSTGDIKNFNVQLPMKVLEPLGWRER